MHYVLLPVEKLKGSSIVEFTQHDVSRFTNEGGFRKLFDPHVELNNSTIIISINQDQLLLLFEESKLSVTVPIKFATAYFTNGDYVEDFFPDEGYVQ